MIIVHGGGKSDHTNPQEKDHFNRMSQGVSQFRVQLQNQRSRQVLVLNYSYTLAEINSHGTWKISQNPNSSFFFVCVNLFLVLLAEEDWKVKREYLVQKRVKLHLCHKQVYFHLHS